MAHAMVALRSEGGTAASVRAAIDSGALIRTHVLRPTWHLVAAPDLRWLLALTSPRVEAGLVGRHRQLGIDTSLIGRALEEVTSALSGRNFLTRPRLADRLRVRGFVSAEQPLFGQQVGHLLLIAELRGLICSGPLAAREHTYALVDEVVAPFPARERAEALAELVHRFVAGHGPVSTADLARWTRLTRAEMRQALAEPADAIESVSVDGEQLWLAPSAALPETRPARAQLLSTFDEAFLSYRRVGFPRSAAHPAGDKAYRFAEAGGGVVIFDGFDVGKWKRTLRGGESRLGLELDSSLSGDCLKAIELAAGRLRSVW